jgi:hypothetical protein
MCLMPHCLLMFMFPPATAGPPPRRAAGRVSTCPRRAGGLHIRRARAGDHTDHRQPIEQQTGLPS